VGKACTTRAGLAPGARITPTFRLRPKRAARGESVTVTFAVTSPGLETQRDRATLKVRKR
jgi:hypothetical protein